VIIDVMMFFGVERLRLGIKLMLMTLLLSACVSSAPTHFYGLQDGRALASSPLEAKDSVGVAVVTIPRLLNRPQLVRRTSEAELIFEEQHQWGGRLQEDIQQLLMDEWQRLDTTRLFYAYPSTAQINSTREVRSVDIIQLDGQLGGIVQLQAVCRAKEVNSRQLLWQKNLSLSEQMTTQKITDYVTILRHLIRRLAKECQPTMNSISH
jgi:uncharacterized lipoprotein YmbA